jgi:two-component system nitrogen regulation response regulator NtrX
MTGADLLVVDDESDIRMLIKGILEDEGYSIRQAANSRQVYDLFAEYPPQLVILDIWLQNSDHDGLEILKTIKASHPQIPVIMISGHGTIETAISAIRMGAYDFIEKPFKSDRLLLMIRRALEAADLKRENETLRQKAEGPAELIGDSPVMTAVQSALSRVAQTNSRVLLTGEPGTGKDIAARAIHRLSKRANKPFVVLNCAVLRPDRLETELFGSVDGVMGEAARAGVLEQASGGTLFLDEVADMPLETQGKIVRVLQDQKFQRVGGQEVMETDVRVIASTNRDLLALTEQGHFRQDLYYRLNVVPIEMPPLRGHLADIPALVRYFARLISRQSGMPERDFLDSAIAAMQAYDWPGNVRQLRNAVEWMIIMGSGASGEPVSESHLPPAIAGAQIVPAAASLDMISLPLREARESFEREYLLSQIKRFDGNISKTAQFVGMERSALHRKLKQLGISIASKQNEDEAADAAQNNRKIA